MISTGITLKNIVYLVLANISENSASNLLALISLQYHYTKKKESTLKLHRVSSHNSQGISFRDRLYLYLKYTHNCHDVC